MHIHFLIPCYGGQISEVTFTSFLRFVVKARDWGIDWSLDTLVNESLIPRGRNALAARALMNPLATHVFFLDADIGFEPEYVTSLLAEDVDVIGGGYPKKSLPIDYVVNPAHSGDSDPRKAEVQRIGTGFLLVKRQVFERMASAMPHLKYRDDCGLDASINNHLYAFFECGLFGSDVFMSEDWLFCNRWRDLGGKIYISKCFALTHVGNYSFSEANQAVLLGRLASSAQMAGGNPQNPLVTLDQEETPASPSADCDVCETPSQQPKRRRSSAPSKAKPRKRES